VAFGTGLDPIGKAMECIMQTAVEYRKMAEECLEWATTALNDEVRANYVGLAQIWLKAASKLDGGLPIRVVPVPAHATGDGKLEPS
jgi:hypothetical protein